MPTYVNNTSATIKEKVRAVNGMDLTLTIEPGKTLQTEYILLDSNLTKTSDAPFFNPLSAAGAEVTSTGPGDDQTVQINRYTNTIAILNQSSAIVNVFLNSKSNTPALKSFPNTERTIEIGDNVNQVICEFPAAATIYVEERK